MRSSVPHHLLSAHLQPPTPKPPWPCHGATPTEHSTGFRNAYRDLFLALAERPCECAQPQGITVLPLTSGLPFALQYPSTDLYVTLLFFPTPIPYNTPFVLAKSPAVAAIPGSIPIYDQSSVLAAGCPTACKKLPFVRFCQSWVQQQELGESQSSISILLSVHSSLISTPCLGPCTRVQPHLDLSPCHNDCQR